MGKGVDMFGGLQRAEEGPKAETTKEQIPALPPRRFCHRWLQGFRSVSYSVNTSAVRPDLSQRD